MAFTKVLGILDRLFDILNDKGDLSVHDVMVAVWMRGFTADGKFLIHVEYSGKRWIWRVR